MTKITLEIDGMYCGMCEAHINDAIRRNFDVKKVTSSHSKGKTEVICERIIGKRELDRVIAPTGYRIIGYSCAPYEKKGLFGIK